MASLSSMAQTVVCGAGSGRGGWRGNGESMSVSATPSAIVIGMSGPGVRPEQDGSPLSGGGEREGRPSRGGPEVKGVGQAARAAPEVRRRIAEPIIARPRISMAQLG
jgi:hypothetical protein